MQSLRRFSEASIDESVARHLGSGSLISFLIQACGAALIILSEILMARLLGAEGYGVLAMVLAWLQVLSMIALFGSNFLLLRFVPVYANSESWSLLRGLLQEGAWGSLLISIIIYSVMAVVLATLSESLSEQVRMAFYVGIAALPFYALSAQRQSILRGLNRVAMALSPELIIRPLLLIVFLILVAAWKQLELTPSIALSLNVLAAGAAFALGWYWQNQAMPDKVRTSHPERRTHEWLRMAFPLFMIAGIQLLIIRIDIIMLGSIAGRQQAGFYAAASRIADLVIFALAAANAVFAPAIASMHARGDMAKLQKILVLLAKGMLLFTVPLVVAIGILGHSILGVFGNEYKMAYIPLLVLVAGQMVNALSGPVGYLLTMTGHQVQSLRILGLVAVINIVLNATLIPLYGMIGAAVATAVTTVLWNLMMRRAIREYLGIEASVLVLFGRRT